MRRALLSAVCLFAVACGGAPADGRREGYDAQRPTNVVLVSIDSLRADHLASYGYDRETAPNLDRLAAGGVLFEQVVAESSWTLPTHHSILTGLSSAVHGVLSDDVRLSEQQTTLAEVFHAAGYRTAGIWSGAYLHPVFGFNQGFDRWIGVGRSLKLDQEDFDLAGPKDARRRAINGANVNSHKARTSEAVTAQALEFLDELDREPFFLFLHYFDVHYDYMPPEAYWRRFDPDYAGSYTPEKYISDKRVQSDMDSRELQHVIARYDGEILYVDEHIGQLLKRLERLGLSEQTLLVVTSDHGEEFFEHGYKGHFRTLFDEVLLVPLIFSQTGRVFAGARVERQVRQIDIAPTILEWVGLPVPSTIMGVSLAACLLGRTEGDDLPAISRLHSESMPGYWISVRHPNWKLLLRHRRATGLAPADFDLSLDPEELNPVSDQSESARLAREELKRWREFENETLERLQAKSAAIELPDALQSELEGLGYTDSEE